MNNLKKYFFPILIVIVALVIPHQIAFAATPFTCASIAEGSPEDDPPLILFIACPLIKAINVLVFASTLVFAAMLGWGAIKMSLALGDPKGYEAAKNTMFYAFIGFCVVVFSFVILNIVSRIFGWSIGGNPNDLFMTFQTNFENFLGSFGIRFN